MFVLGSIARLIITGAYWLVIIWGVIAVTSWLIGLVKRIFGR